MGRKGRNRARKRRKTTLAGMKEWIDARKCGERGVAVIKAAHWLLQREKKLNRGNQSRALVTAK